MMAQVMVLLAGLLLLSESQASDLADRSTHQDFRSKSDYDKFITPNLNRMKHGNELGASPFTVVDDKPILQSSTQVQNSSDPISLSIFGIGLVSFVTMLGLTLWRALQPATIPTNTVSALGGQVMEMKAQGSNVKTNSGRLGWDPLGLGAGAPKAHVRASSTALRAVDDDEYTAPKIEFDPNAPVSSGPDLWSSWKNFIYIGSLALGLLLPVFFFFASGSTATPMR